MLFTQKLHPLKQINEIPQLQVFETQVGGKSPKFINKQCLCIYKPFTQAQYKFYQSIQNLTITDSNFKIVEFIPKFYRCLMIDNLPKMKLRSQQYKHMNQWINNVSSRVDKLLENNNFIEIENICYGFKSACVLDLKVGLKPYKVKQSKSKWQTFNTKKFLISGLLNQQLPKEQQFLNKYECQNIPIDMILELLALFFYDGKIINKILLINILDKLKNLILSLHSYIGYIFISTSLLIAYDGSNHDKIWVGLIDFQKCQKNNISINIALQQSIYNVIYYIVQIIQKIELLSYNLKYSDIYNGKYKYQIPIDKLNQLQIQK